MKNRMINTKFWSDGWVINLDPLERYLFLYFLTNEHTNICGIYELPMRVMARETGIEDEMLEKMLAKMSDKILYVGGWVAIKNFSKHQRTSGNVAKGVEIGRNEVPNEIMAKISTYWNTPPCVGNTARNLNSNLNLNLNSNVNLNPVDNSVKKRDWRDGDTITLYDGTVALRRFRNWVDQSNPTLKLDRAYYKELP